MSNRTALGETLEQWADAGGAPTPAVREALLGMADVLDAAADAPREATPLINAYRYYIELVRKLAPAAAPEGDGFEAAMSGDWVDGGDG